MTPHSVAKTTILKWFDGSGQPSEKRGKLSAGIDRFFEEVAKRERWLECRTTLLTGHDDSRFYLSNQNLRVTPCREGLAVSAVVPSWGFGWSSVFRDEYVYDTLKWLGHYASQYIYRSQVAKALMIAWERNSVVFHPFGPATKVHRYGPIIPIASSKNALSVALKDISNSWNIVENAPRSRSAWGIRNTLDPAIHQAIYQFLRAQMLISADLNLEAAIALDCVLESLQTLNWSATAGDLRGKRAELVTALGFGSTFGEVAEHLYFVRNNFSAHAGGWRWWDAEEYADSGFILEASDLALRVLRRAADTEPSIRRINPKPSDWNCWLLENFPLLFNAIWFRVHT